MLDILSQEKEQPFDLTEIKKNAEICIERINYEINKMKKNISSITEKELDYEKYDGKKKPDLPKNMKENSQNLEEMEEFTGFYQRHLPDKITKIEYNLETEKDYICLIIIKYYTTVQDLRTKKKNNIEGKAQSPFPDKNEIILEKNDSSNEEEKEEEDEYITSKTFYRNKIEDDEEKIFEKLVKLYRETRRRVDKITIINEIENNWHKKIKEKETLSRVVLYSIRNQKLFWKG